MDENHPSGVSFNFQCLFSEPKRAAPPAGTSADEIIDMTNDDEELGGFCPTCLKDLSDVNFLLQMKHVKECKKMTGRETGVLEPICENPKRGLICGKQALVEFLHFYGYGSLVQDLMKTVKTLSNLMLMDAVDLEQMTRVEGLSQKKRLIFALEQYKKTGHVYQRTSTILDKRKNSRLKDRTNTRSLKHLCVDGKHGMTQDTNKSGTKAKSSVDIEKILLDTFWKSSRDTEPRSPEGCVSRIYEGRTSWCHRVVARDQSLWFGAADCRLRLEKGCLEERLRSGTRTSVVQQEDSVAKAYQTIAMKQMRLKALKDELQVHVSTVEELRSMIRALEEEMKDS